MRGEEGRVEEDSQESGQSSAILTSVAFKSGITHRLIFCNILVIQRNRHKTSKPRLDFLTNNNSNRRYCMNVTLVL